VNYDGPLECRPWFDEIPRGGGSWRDKAAFDHCSYRSVFEHLTAIRRQGPLSRDDIPLICSLRNEEARLPVFFDHYRKLGVTRFMMIDNASEDRSMEILLAEEGVDVFLTRKSYLEGQSGLYWVNGLAHALCRGHWMVRADADELLVYDGMERHGLPDLARRLRANGRDRLFSPMLDLYSSSGLADGTTDIARFLQQDAWFDSDGYDNRKCEEGWYVTGGPRHRMFRDRLEGHSDLLVKYPFVRVRPELSFVNSHYLWPFDNVRDPPSSALLHLKLLGDFVERSARYVREGQHWKASVTYRKINRIMEDTPSIPVRYSGSRRYEGPQSLIDAGLVRPIDWNA
jgi:hypothetical protein